jgi:Zn-dependent protease with chaperone function
VSVSSTAELQAEYFDGRSGQAHPVRLRTQDRELLIEGDAVALRVPLRDLRWPERQRHGTRRIVLDSGGIVRCADAAAFDAFARSAGAGESITVRVQQSWKLTLAAVLVLIGVAVAGYRWGLPAAAHAVLAFVPDAVDERVGASAYDAIAPWLLKPSRVAPERQQRLRSTFEQAVTRAHSPRAAARIQLRFHAAPRLGTNAFALPGGIIVVSDEMLQRLDQRDDVVLGVLGHELAHVQRRHGMRLLVQTTLLGAATSVAFGDFSTLLAGVPALLGQLGYSRDLEREADDDAVAFLHANGISPLVMITLFEALARPAGAPRGAQAASEPASATEAASAPAAPAPASVQGLGIAFSSHPADAERIARFRNAAAERR